MNENPYVHGPMGWVMLAYLVITLGGALVLVLYSTLQNYLIKHRRRQGEE